MNFLKAYWSDPILRRMLVTSLVVCAILVALIGFGFFLEGQLLYRATGDQAHNLLLVHSTIFLSLLSLIVTITANVVQALLVYARQLSLGMYRLVVIVVPAMFAAALYWNFAPQWNWHVGGYARPLNIFTWIVGGLSSSALFASLSGWSVAFAGALIRWIAEGFRNDSSRSN